MIDFLEWLVFKEGLHIVHVNPEEDWEAADAAWGIAKIVGINPGRDKEPTILALNDAGDVIGAVFTSWSEDHDASQCAGRPIACWQYDVVVHPQWQGFEMVGLRLIKQAEEERRTRSAELGQDAYTRLWVVNPKLARVLQTPRYGFEADAEYDDGTAHLRKY